jgi:hypothetical protein
VLPLVLLLAACQTPPLLPQPDEGLAARCDAVFPRRPWQFSHSLFFDAAAGRRGVLIGVLRIDPARSRIHCTMLTVEGIALFEAEEEDGRLTLRRALPPFDAPDFARGLMSDIRLIFFAPLQPWSALGLGPDAVPTCRCRTPQGLLDLRLPPQGGWELLQYDAWGQVRRRVTASAEADRAVARQMALAASGVMGYTLRFELIAAEPLSASAPRETP